MFRSCATDDVLTPPRNMPLKNFALTRIQTFPLIDSGLPIVKRDAQEQEAGDSPPPLNLADVQGVAVQKDAAVLQQPSEKAVLYTTVQIRSSNHNQPVGVFNHTSWIVADQRAKPLLALEEAEWQQVTMQPNNLQKLDIPSFPVDQGRWIDLVINNMDDKGHPFHMVSCTNLVLWRKLTNCSTDTTFMLFCHIRQRLANMGHTIRLIHRQSTQSIPLHRSRRS